MTPLETGLAGLALLIILFFSRLPVAYAMALVGFVGFSYLRGIEPGLNLLAQDMYKSFSSPGLTVIPLFVLMGQFAFRGGISRRLYDAAHRFTGGVPGGLAMATVCACSAFGAVCGSSPATAATMATVGLPEMKRHGYQPRLAAGCVAAGGSMGMLMPPSVVLIVYGMLTQQSIGRLFVAGVAPALFITLLFVLTVLFICLRDPSLGPAGQRFSFNEKLSALGGLVDTLAVFALVMGGLFMGWFTPSEAGGVGAMGVFIAAVARRRLGWRAMAKALVDTLQTSCMVLLLVTGAVIFGHFLAVTGLPMALAMSIDGLSLPGWAVVMLMVLIYLVGGCVIDALALIMLTIPMFLPIITGLGLDPIWFGVVLVLVTQMGVITPPVGINAYVVSGVAPDIPLEEIFRGALPFLAALIVGTVALVFWPDIVLWLPDLMYGE